MAELDDKVVMVTGAARGLGRAYSLRLAALGARVAVTDLNLKSYSEFDAEAAAMGAETTADEIISGGGQALAFEFDAGDRDATVAAVDEILAAWGRVDVLIANAGGGKGSPGETRASLVPVDLLESVTRSNFFATVHSCSAVVPAMKSQRSGKIVTVASYAGLAAPPGGGYAHYAANKAAIIHHTRYLAQELGPFGITANCIAPGFIGTARIRQLLLGGSGGDPASEIALRRLGTPEDCARVMEFLATDLSDYVTGAVIPVDGGWVRGRD